MGYYTYIYGEFEITGADGSKGMTEEHTRVMRYFLENSQMHCCWSLNKEGTAIIPPDETQKMGDYVNWIKKILDDMIIAWGYTLNGSCQWDGEEKEDMGIIEIKDNVITIKEVVFTYRAVENYKFDTSDLQFYFHDADGEEEEEDSDDE